MMHQLTYSIANELLTGTIQNQSFHIKAASGGRRGRAYDKPTLHGLHTWNPGMKLPEIAKSVGKSSKSAQADNRKADVNTVQCLLNINGHKLTPDGLIGPKTLAAIEKFQRSIGMAKPDGRVDPRGGTLKALLRKVAGGPLPPGIYELEYLSSHKTFGKCIFLKPVRVDEMIPGITEFKKRNGFFIHGRGDRGSDGCIVPYNPNERANLNSAVKSSPKKVRLAVRDPYAPPALVNQWMIRARTA